jgi:Flp pilus assembly protein TadD
LAGFLGGVACAALVGVLLVWAQRDAQPRPEDPAMAGQPAAGDAGHPEGPELSEREAAALERVAQAVEADPTDIMARKQYAVALLSTGRFFPAFEQAEILLASDPGDPDGLYVQVMVRMWMGQEAEARGLLERLVEAYPEHVPALTALGVLALRQGGIEAADEYWDQAVLASGGENAEVEQLRAAARRQLVAADASAPPVPAAPAPDRYTLRIDLGPGASTPAGGVLFVSLRQGESGPPAAVRRIADPRFPLTVTLGSGDSMLGRPLPDAGTVSARIDGDGNVSTRGAGEPEGQVDMAVGETAELTLQ